MPTGDDVARVLPALPFGDVEPHEVSIEPLGRPPVVGGTAGLWRVSARGSHVVVKVLHCDEGGDPRWRPGPDPGHWYYWRREALVYGSCVLDRLAPSLRAPRIYTIDAPDGGGVAVWMEHLPGTMLDHGSDRAALGDLAFRLGEAQGRYALDPPDEPWLSRHWLRDYLGLREDDAPLLDDPAAWDALEAVSPLSRVHAGEYRELWDRRHDHVAAVEAAPRTLGHFDMHPKNVLVAADGTLVPVDWSFAGSGAIGEDAGNLHPDTVLDFHAPAADLAPMFDTIAQRHHAGLVAAGCDISLAEVRRTMAAATVAKYAWIVPAMLAVAVAGKPTLNGRPAGEGMPVWAATAGFLVRLQDDALR